MNRRKFVAGSFIGATGSVLAHQVEQNQALNQVHNQADVNQIINSTPTCPEVKPEKKVFDFSEVIKIAETIAKQSYKPARLKLVTPFANLSYDHYRAIRFRRNKDPLRQSAKSSSFFGLDLLPPGRYYQDRVRIFLVEPNAEQATEIPFSLDRFDFDPNFFVRDSLNLDEQALKGLSYSGFRLRFPLNYREVDDEFLVFQGASYFRAVAANTLYGLSARGLAIKTGKPEGEEFPRFSRFWIYRPDNSARSVQIDALLESESVTGAYSFLVFPGQETIFTVRSVLFPRKKMVDYGIAALTSMYNFSPCRRRNIDDYRNAVCDSNGLAMHTGAGARLWRSLHNPQVLQYSAFMDKNPRGFGLIQRLRDFSDYQDFEAKYEKRPSAWIEPLSDWGRGNVSLIEIPTNSEFNDNIIAFWQGGEPLEAGKRYEFAYNLIWSDTGENFADRAKIKSCRIGKSVNNPDNFTVVLDYEFRNPVNINDCQFVATASRGETIAPHLVDLGDNIIRAAFEYRPVKNENAELQAAISNAGNPIGETWLYRWTN